MLEESEEGGDREDGGVEDGDDPSLSRYLLFVVFMFVNFSLIYIEEKSEYCNYELIINKNK